MEEFVCIKGQLARKMKGGEPLVDKQLRTGSREITGSGGSEQLIAKRSPEQVKRLVLTPHLPANHPLSFSLSLSHSLSTALH